MWYIYAHVFDFPFGLLYVILFTEGYTLSWSLFTRAFLVARQREWWWTGGGGIDLPCGIFGCMFFGFTHGFVDSMIFTGGNHFARPMEGKDVVFGQHLLWSIFSRVFLMLVECLCMTNIYCGQYFMGAFSGGGWRGKMLCFDQH